jgi:hypothetical protein
MVKIYLKDAKGIEAQYLLSVQIGLSIRIQALKSVLNHLSGSAINSSSPGYEIARGFAEKIINHVEGKELYLPGDYNLSPYSATIAKYLGGTNLFIFQNFAGVSKLINELLANGESQLADLLICQPAKLEAKNITLGWGAFNSFEIFLIKLIFKTENQQTYWDTIREFFRNYVPIYFCPYCNYDSVEHVKSMSGSAYTSALDHFHSQTDFPLLCYSFYNLIPSDTNCNSFKKHKKKFSTIYHLHPYLFDYGQHANFKATYLPPFKQVIDIELIVNASIGTEMYEKMMGDVTVYTPGHKNGNINVFKINELYKGRDFKKNAKHTLDALRDMSSNLNTLKKLMGFFVLSEDRRKKAYQSWYSDKIQSPFSKTEFTNDRFSKLKRDLHDNHVSKLPIVKLYIGNLINEDNGLD